MSGLRRRYLIPLGALAAGAGLAAAPASAATSGPVLVADGESVTRGKITLLASAELYTP
jgi:hypothetical protein